MTHPPLPKTRCLLCLTPFPIVVLLLLSLLLPLTTAQPFSIVSYPTPNTTVPAPGVLSSADVASPPTPVSASASTVTTATTTTTTTTSTSTSSTSSCTSNWCTQSGQWLPTNVNYVLIAVTVGLVLFIVRADRALCGVLICWTSTTFILFLVNQFALWYVVLVADFAVYFALYGGDKKKTEEDEDEEDDEDEDDEEEYEEGEEYPTGDRSHRDSRDTRTNSQSGFSNGVAMYSDGRTAS